MSIEQITTTDPDIILDHTTDPSEVTPPANPEEKKEPETVVDDKQTPTVNGNGTQEDPAKVAEAIAKQKEILANLQRATAAEKTRMKEAREARRASVATIDMEDEGAKAWNANIEDKVAPVQQVLVQQQAEVLEEVFEELIATHDMSSELADRVLETYERVKNNSGLNAKAVMKDLLKAYAAETYEEQQTIKVKAAQARDYSKDPAVTKTESSGGGGQASGKAIRIPAEEYALWKGAGMSDEQIKEHYKNKK